ncbi:hypothetical protein ETD83_32985 [Actinomadura soli]|uniref:Uncharacterized protein n=1 Tax=Actinomadura soli TaxID=2508997 RepID=A0A5C4J3G6_9ACTN|nr:hypothetical protein [Actinomadura soli]TMQ90993.1 hypothetical protein ETD83_32985 [Actinomadura soli]
MYKPLGGIWHGDEGQVRVPYTTPVTDLESLLDPAISRTAHLFQEQVPKAFEARAVVVGEQVFAMRIEAGSDRGWVHPPRTERLHYPAKPAPGLPKRERPLRRRHSLVEDELLRMPVVHGADVGQVTTAWPPVAVIEPRQRSPGSIVAFSASSLGNCAASTRMAGNAANRDLGRDPVGGRIAGFFVAAHHSSQG